MVLLENTDLTFNHLYRACAGPSFFIFSSRQILRYRQIHSCTVSCLLSLPYLCAATSLSIRSTRSVQNVSYVEKCRVKGSHHLAVKETVDLVFVQIKPVQKQIPPSPIIITFSTITTTTTIISSNHPADRARSFLQVDRRLDLYPHPGKTKLSHLSITSISHYNQINQQPPYHTQHE